MAKSEFNGINEDNLLDEKTFQYVFSITDTVERTKVIIELETIALESRKKKEFSRLLKAYQNKFARGKRSKESNLTEFTNPPIDNLKCGKWKANDSKTLKIRYNAATLQEVEEVATITPILVEALIRNIDEETEKIKLTFLKNEKWQSITIPRSKVANKAKILDLADYGIEVNTGNSALLVEYIADLVALNDIPYLQGSERCGWHEEDFIPYTKKVVFDGEIDYKSTFASIKEEGNYDIWLKEVLACRKFSKVTQIAMAVSFASVLNEKVDVLPFILHLWGGTGSGKTVALMIAMSIWGDPEIGKLTRSLNNTHVAMTRYAAFLKDLPFAGDELQTIKNRWASFDELVMLLAEGVDRGRGKIDGGLHALKKWKCAFLFTGEEPITKANSGAGVKNRVLEVEASEKIVEDGHRTASIVKSNFGFAGQMFLKNLPENEKLVKLFRDIYEQILAKDLDITEKQAVICAIVMLADRLSIKHIFNDTPLEFEDLRPFLATSAQVDMANRAYLIILDWVKSNVNKFSEESKTEVWGKILDDGYVAINRLVLNDFLSSKNIDFEAIKRGLKEAGNIKTSPDGKYAIVTRTGELTTRMVHIKLDYKREIQNEFEVTVEE